MVGLVLAGDGIGVLLADVPAGIILRHLGKRGMVGGLASMIAATVALFWVRSVWIALALRIMAGIGSALYFTAQYLYVSNAVDRATRGRAVAMYGGMLRVGRFIGPALSGAIATAWGLEAVFLACGCLLGVLALAVVSGTPDAAIRPPDNPVQTQGLRLGQVRTLLRSQRTVFASAGLGFALGQSIREGSRAFVPLYADGVLGLGVGTIGLIVSLASAMDMILFYPAGVIMDRWGRKFAIVPSIVVQALGMALLPLTGSAAGLVLAAGLVSFGNGLSSGTMMTLGADLAPVEGRSEFLGMWRLFGDVGFTGGPLLIGGVAALLTLHAAGFVIAGVGLTSALIFAFRVPETLERVPLRVTTPGATG
jgi:MFS family permease